MIPTGAVEKQKLVYIMNRDAAARLTISSPLEAHKSHTLVFDIVGIDVGFENPMFACLELDYEVGFEIFAQKFFLNIVGIMLFDNNIVRHQNYNRVKY